MAQVNDITEELHKEIEAVPEEDRAEPDPTDWTVHGLR
jgi:hypothetical protein